MLPSPVLFDDRIGKPNHLISADVAEFVPIAVVLRLGSEIPETGNLCFIDLGRACQPFTEAIPGVDGMFQD